MDKYTSDLFASQSVSDICRSMARIVQTPIARASDPLSSHLAAEAITKSGARSDQQNKAAEAVKQFPGHTSHELAALTCGKRNVTDWRYALARRLPECETAGRVRKGPKRTCSVTGRKAHVWEVA